MRFATRQEIEYLGSIQAKGTADASVIDEMSRRLDALRRFDQFISEADWRPHHARGPKRAKRRNAS